MSKEKLTKEQALQIVGGALAHSSLKLSQQEHLVLIESFKVLSEEVKDIPSAVVEE